jgi:two-component system sensor histidine kinase CpxA
MRSIFAKIVVWSLGTFALSLVAYWSISRLLERRGPGAGDPIHRVVDLAQDDACRAYEEGGSRQLAALLTRLRTHLPGEHFLTDARGRDLANGADRSELLRHWRPHGPPFRLPDGRFIHVARLRDPRYRFISLSRPWFPPPNILPYYGSIVLVIAGMGAILAAHLAAPLRRLRRVVDRFGRGDFTARVGSSRRDEIGELARAFDEMAGRIETLLAAERRLLQDVSHELRSPLTRLDVAADLVLSSNDRVAAVGRIKREIERLTILVTELLQLTRAEGDPQALEPDNIRLDDLVRDLAENLALEAEAKGCRVELIGAEPCWSWAEPELVHRAVENVVRNAIRHAPEGTTVDVSLIPYDDRARIIVRDRGAGVPEESLESIFEPFFRVDGHRSRASGGVGLGLTIARRAVEVHGGTIHAANAEPGLAVTIELPVVDPPAG